MQEAEVVLALYRRQHEKQDRGIVECTNGTERISCIDDKQFDANLRKSGWSHQRKMEEQTTWYGS